MLKNLVKATWKAAENQIAHNSSIFTVQKRLAGHSKWQNIRHIKGAKDAERSALFTKLSRLMKVAVIEGGSADVKANLKLEQVIEQAKRANMPNSTLQSVLKSCQADKSNAKSAMFEFKGPGGSIFLCEVLTANLHQLRQNIASILRKHHVVTGAPSSPLSSCDVIEKVTGAGHGIGKQLALAYACAGATVVAWDVNANNNEETVKEIAHQGYPTAHAYTCDVSNRSDVFEVAKKVQQQVGDVTILINNAGIMPTHTLLDHTKEEIKRIFGINVMAHFWTIQAFLPAMKKNNHGHIVALSSVAGIFGLANLSPYCGSKFAVRGLMEGLSEELRMEKSKVCITTVFPYMTNTGLCQKPKIRFENFMALLEPEEVAQAIMKAQRTGVFETTVPAYFMTLNNIGRMLPTKASLLFRDFIDSGVESDL